MEDPGPILTFHKHQLGKELCGNCLGPGKSTHSDVDPAPCKNLPEPHRRLGTELCMDSYGKGVGVTKK